MAVAQSTGASDGARVPTDNTPLIVVDRVGKEYANGTMALEDISFDVSEGEFVSLVGPSGCGKSTILRMIAGLGAITSGDILFEGLPPRQARQERSDLAFVFQDATLMPWRDVIGNVELPLELRGVSKSQRRKTCGDALATVGLAEVADAYPRELSGGMRMRVSLARALAAHPRVLLMDEPFGALDEITRQRLNGELLRLCALADWTVVFVTHNVFEAAFLSSRILVMSRRPGRIVADVPVDLPYPRVPEVRTSAEYSRLVGQVVGLLEGAAGSSEED
ncbi:MAG: ABC transporter ATP-binding protein [Chloroflexota bacterium]|nr:ABC transporter ATP-binding protein [Chloroflexota bacterium]